MISSTAIRAKWDAFVIVREEFFKHKDLPQDDSVYISAKNSYEKFRNEFLTMYYSLVGKVAERMSKRIREVDIDDLVSWGTDGLFHAIDRFDPSLENKFETFAVHRIKGSILDNIRQVDWVPRLVRQRHSKIQKAKHSLECDLGRVPSKEEIANYLGMDIDEFLEIESKASPISCVSIFAGSSKEEGEELQLESFVSTESQPLNSILRNEVFLKLMGKSFIPLERKIIHMHYYENMTMKEISDSTGYSESRISQMHTKVLERLQKKIALNPSYMSGLEAMLHP